MFEINQKKLEKSSKVLKYNVERLHELMHDFSTYFNI